MQETMSRHQLLQSIISTSQKLKCSLASRRSDTDVRPHLPTQIDIPPLRLEESMAIFQVEMQRSGLLPQISQLASNKAKELATHYRQSYERVCNDLVSSRSQGVTIDDTLQHLRRTFESLYEKKYLTSFLVNARKSQDDYLFRVKMHMPSCVLPDRRPAFNHGCTPLLEAYFQTNAYPSAADRLTLAEKTNMIPRQIEVWFQNHRTRAKKEGRPVTRGSSAVALEHALQNAYSAAPVSPHSTNSSPFGSPCPDEESGDEIEFQSTHVPSPLDSSNSRPPHAFPAVYSPNCVEDPFPNRHGIFSFPPPIWRRSPAASIRHKTPPVNIHDVIELFATKLHLRDAQPVSQKRKRLSTSNAPWFAARVTIPPPAPHPALVRSPTSMLDSPKVLTHSWSPATIFFPPSAKGSPLNTRNFIRPQKTPPFSKHLPSAFCSNNPSSRLSLSAASSRTSSFASMSSSQSRSTSTSSTSSIEPSTPPHLPVEFPISPSLYVSEDELRIFEDLFSSFHDQTQSVSSLGVFPPFDKEQSSILRCNSMIPPPLHVIQAHS